MNKKQFENLMQGLIVVSTILIMLGALLKLEHYPYANQILYIGIFSNLVLSSFEISRLKKIIKELKTERTIIEERKK